MVSQSWIVLRKEAGQLRENAALHNFTLDAMKTCSGPVEEGGLSRPMFDHLSYSPLTQPQLLVQFTNLAASDSSFCKGWFNPALLPVLAHCPLTQASWSVQGTEVGVVGGCCYVICHSWKAGLPSHMK